jgi:hypothetical protein
MTTITNVTIGDERSSKDITSSFVTDHVQHGKVDVVASSSLVPVFDSSPTITLTDQEIQEIHDKAIEACGGASDNRCIESNIQSMQQERLKDKRFEAQSSVNQIKGRRLTVRYTDPKGEHVMVVPDGQRFQLDGLPVKESSFTLPTLSGTTLSVLSILGTIVATFLLVFSIAATYKTLASDYSRVIAIAGTTVATLFPYSGYFIMFGYFLIREVYKYSLEDYTAKILAWVIVVLLGALYISSATVTAMALTGYSVVKNYFSPPKK